MKNYRVTLPIAGSINCYVEAVDDSAALEKALNMECFKNIETAPGVELNDINSFDQILEGNCVYVDVYEAEVEEQESE